MLPTFEVMKILIEASVAILLVAVASESSYAKEWRGLVPLRSTRTDVVRLMNQCSDQKEACRFTLEKENVYILFSGGLSTKYGECATRLPPETVMFIEVAHRVNLSSVIYILTRERLNHSTRLLLLSVASPVIVAEKVL